MAQPIQGKVGNAMAEGTFKASEYTGKNGTTSVIVELLANGGKSAVWTSQGRLADIMPKATVSNKPSDTEYQEFLAFKAMMEQGGKKPAPVARPGRPSKNGRDLVK